MSVLSKGVLNLLPSKGNVKMKGAKPKPANGLNNEKTKLERGQSPLNATPKSENPEVQINRNENVREAQDSHVANGGRTESSVVLIGKLKPLRSRRGTTQRNKTESKPKPKRTKTKSEPSPKPKKQKKNAKPPRVRYDRSTKKLLQQEEENKAKRKKEAKEIATKARQKAIEADKLKQAARSLESKPQEPTTTQMGSFKLAGSKPRDNGKNKIGIMSYAPTISLYKDTAPVDARVSVPLYQDPFTRRLEAYAKRELDPSVVSYLNTFVARNLLRSYTDRGVNASV